MKVCVDLNGVIANPAESLRAILCRMLGIFIPVSTFDKTVIGKDFQWERNSKLTKRVHSADYAHAKKLLFETYRYQSMPPIEGAKEAIIALLQQGVEVVIVSDARSVSRDMMVKWLRKNGFPKLDVILTRKSPKTPHQCQCTIVIDNEVGQLVPLLENTPRPHLIHFLPNIGTTGSAQALSSTHPDIPSVRGWKDVLARIEEIREQTAQQIAA